MIYHGRSRCISTVITPTPEQTDAFSKHLVSHRSWYKHLPFFPPGATFQFFLNPYAGWEVTRDGNEFAYVEIRGADYFRHASRLSTAAYQHHFGHWDFRVVAQARPDTPGSVLLPPLPEVMCVGRFTAFLNPAPWIFELRFDRLKQECAEFLKCAEVGLLRRLRLAVGAKAANAMDAAEKSRYLPMARVINDCGDASSLPDARFDFIASEGNEQYHKLRTLLAHHLSTLQGPRDSSTSSSGADG